MNITKLFHKFVSDNYCNKCNSGWSNYQEHCEKCHLIADKYHSHCCKCCNKWYDKSQIHCNNCFKNGLVAFSFDGINITYIISKYNGEGIVYNLKGQIMFNGNFKSGKYDNDGVLYFPDGKLKFKGYFSQGFYCGYGSLFDENGDMMNGFFLNSKLITEFKKIKKDQNNEQESCNLCMSDFDKNEIFPICGSKDCVECCVMCIKSVVQKINCNRGSILTHNCILCPFCRKDISENVISVYNPELAKYVSAIKKLKSTKEIVGLCSECNNHEIHKLNVECGEQNNKEKYICEKCLTIKAYENVKNCPNCGLKVFKTDGCHFMKCICKKAWCWHCLKIMAYDEVHNWNCKYCGKGS
jgi:hypothetical protein